MSACPACDDITAATAPAPQNDARELQEKFEAALVTTHDYIAFVAALKEGPQAHDRNAPNRMHRLHRLRLAALRARHAYQAACARLIG